MRSAGSSPLGSVVIGDRLVFSKGHGRQNGGIDPLLFQVVGDIERPRRRELPIRRVSLGEVPPDGNVVSMSLDADHLVRHSHQDLDDPLQMQQSRRKDKRFLKHGDSFPVIPGGIPDFERNLNVMEQETNEK